MEWPQLKDVAWARAAAAMRRPVLFDGRTCSTRSGSGRSASPPCRSAARKPRVRLPPRTTGHALAWKYGSGAGRWRRRRL
ncbi:hypothetical protein ABZ572_31275 [Streptomyces sp. NPDC018338]|uniref:hypothetical protein n=1 Tax=Streptomyces sp. NPDC018338 TaxID=3157192 RepID=UPI0033D6742F